ncbi:MAG: hypothetical protein CVV32_06305 [Methanomicrobiales archaeon HGW-Methanomicrobiales-3]|jgi:pimeloyl-ACP methyl ester carboxylesterase|nr:MAG: hypothetical protein CVV32_06305 [Methanomicrobiales archaeon HGW-Methanomicrobiales-3]
MNERTLSVFPSFGMSGEKNQMIIVEGFINKPAPVPNGNGFSLYLVNKSGRRITLTTESADIRCGTQSDAQNPAGTIWISARADIPDSSSMNATDRTFDLILLEGQDEINRVKGAFHIYDSVAVLIHGFLASPQTFDSLQMHNDKRLLYLTFDYEKQNFETAITVLASFKVFIDTELTRKGYSGRFDIVCHSMGAQISRLWILNYPNNDNANAGKVRQWIGIAPVNHGSAGADGRLVDILAGFLNRPAFTELKTYSMTTNLLEQNERYERENAVRYRIIIGYNGRRRKLFYVWYENDRIPGFILYLLRRAGFSEGLPVPLSFDGKTKARNLSGKTYFKTYYGDGVVADCHSMLSYASTDAFDGLNHSTIIRDPDVCELIRLYLVSNPDLRMTGDFENEVEQDYHSHDQKNYS